MQTENNAAGNQNHLAYKLLRSLIASGTHIIICANAFKKLCPQIICMLVVKLSFVQAYVSCIYDYQALQDQPPLEKRSSPVIL